VRRAGCGRNCTQRHNSSILRHSVGAEQRPFWQRAIYFVLVGWWFSGFWMGAAWLLSVLIITLPLGFWMSAPLAR
jgi:hypothetical protein